MSAFLDQLDGSVCYVAEIGLNHNGDLSVARKMVDAARDAGATYAKFQWYHPEFFIEESARLGDGVPGSLRTFFARYSLQLDQWEALASHCQEAGVGFACSVFDRKALENYLRLPQTQNSFIKIASCDITHTDLLHAVCQTDLPAVLATGTASEAEIEAAVAILGSGRLVLLECVSAYPARPDSYRLGLLPFWREKYGVRAGVSDHTMGLGVSVASVARGGALIERHFTLDRNLPGADHAMSLTGTEFRLMVQLCEEARQALRGGPREPLPEEEAPRLYGRRATYAGADLASGQRAAASDLCFLRPGVPASPSRREDVLGKRIGRSVRRGEPIFFQDIHE
ncbi:MAG: N-acetylneuraminate synthase family protein [Spirochaetales bacterium]|nr:N-acetylneuraminate synthase family protein [Spirochaetales bacterium]